MNINKTTDWPFNYSSLSCWDIHQTRFNIFDHFVELPKTDTLCCIYSIDEVSMLNYIGHLAILKTKERPSLVIDVPRYGFEPKVFASSDQRYLFLVAHIYFRESREMMMPIIVVDVVKNTFAIFPNPGNCSAFDIVQLQQDLFEIQSDPREMEHSERCKAIHGQQISIVQLKWRRLSRLKNLPEIINPRHRVYRLLGLFFRLP